MSEEDNSGVFPANFGWKYVAWKVWRWFYYNPLTLLFIAQGEMVELAVQYPDIRWLSHIASLTGIAIAQIRNRNRDYSIPINPKA